MSIWRDRDLSRFFAIFPKSRNFCCFPCQMQLLLNTATFHKNCAICAWNSWISRKPTQSLTTSTHITQSLLHSHISVVLYYIACLFWSFLSTRYVLLAMCIDLKMARSQFFTFFRDFSEIPRLLQFPAPFAATFQISAATFSFSAEIVWHP